jgi:hypothetical protein
MAAAIGVVLIIVVNPCRVAFVFFGRARRQCLAVARCALFRACDSTPPDRSSGTGNIVKCESLSFLTTLLETLQGNGGGDAR